MIDYIDGLRLLCSRMRNPFPVIADRLRLKKEPYTVRLKNGITIELRPGLGDSYGFYEVLVRDNYTNWGQTISKGDTVIDVGANIGCFSILASRLVGPTGRVIAIEPEPSTHERLLKNIELNQATNIKPLRLRRSSKSFAYELGGVVPVIIRGSNDSSEIDERELSMDNWIQVCLYLNM